MPMNALTLMLQLAHVESVAHFKEGYRLVEGQPSLEASIHPFEQQTHGVCCDVVKDQLRGIACIHMIPLYSINNLVYCCSNSHWKKCRPLD